MSKLLLRAPPWLITLLWAAPLIEAPFGELPRDLGNGDSVGPLSSVSAISFVALLLWDYALYNASRSRTPPALRDRHGPKVFVSAIAVYAVLASLAAFLYAFDGQPPSALVAASGLLVAPATLLTFAAIGYAAEAMHKAQIATGQKPEWHPLLPLLFIGIGIWFIHRQIQDLLAQPKDPAP